MTTRSSKMYGSASHRVTEGGVSTRVEEDLNTLLVTVGNLVGGGESKVFFLNTNLILPTYMLQKGCYSAKIAKTFLTVFRESLHPQNIPAIMIATIVFLAPPTYGSV